MARAASWKWMERISRKVCTEVGSIAATCKAPRTGAEVKQRGILHTTTKAIAHRPRGHEARRRHEDPIDAVLAAARASSSFAARSHDVHRRTTEGFLRGPARIEGSRTTVAHDFELAFQNEFAVGWRDGRRW